MSNCEVLNNVKLNFDYSELLYEWLINIRKKYHRRDVEETSDNEVTFYLEIVEQRPSNKASLYKI